MGTGSPHFPSPPIHTRLRSLYNSTGRVNHIVQQEGALTCDVADDVHDRRLIWPFTPLVDNRQVRVEPLCKGAGPLDPAGVWRNNYQVTHLLLRDVIQQYRQRIKMVYRHIEESLNLPRMEVHREHPIGTGGADKVGHKFRRNRYTRLIFTVLACIAEIRDDCGDAIRGGPLERINNNQQLHKGIVDRLATRLHDKDVAPPYIFLNLNANFTVAEGPDRRLAKLGPEVGANLMS